MALAQFQDITETLNQSSTFRECLKFGKESSLLHGLTSNGIAGFSSVVNETNNVTTPKINIPFVQDTQPDYALSDTDEVLNQEKVIKLEADYVEIREIFIPYIIPHFKLAQFYTGVDLPNELGLMAAKNIRERLDRDLVFALTNYPFINAGIQSQVRYQDKPSKYRLAKMTAGYTGGDDYDRFNTIQDIVNATTLNFTLDSIWDMVAMAEGYAYDDYEQQIESPDIFLGSTTSSKGYVLIAHPSSWRSLLNDPAFRTLYVGKANYAKDAPQIIKGTDYKGEVQGIHIFVSNQMRWAQKTKSIGGAKVAWNLLLGPNAVKWAKTGAQEIVANDTAEQKMYGHYKFKISMMYGMKSPQAPSLLGLPQRFDFGTVHNFSLI